MSHRSARLTLVFIGRWLPRQGHCCGVQPVAGQLLRLAEIDPIELAVALAVGAPVLASTFIARWLFARREGPQRTAKGEGARRAQPGIPGWRFHRQPFVLSASLVGQGLILHDRHGLVLVLHTHHSLVLTHRFPNSIAHVREPVCATEALLFDLDALYACLQTIASSS